jgi:osmotically inducible protein OsmC
MPSRDATTRWTGGLQKGSGKVSLDSSNLGEYTVSAVTRFENPDGHTSPEELIAAAHSSCLAMNFSGVLAAEQLEADYIDVSAEVTLGPDPAGGFAITSIALTIRVKLDGVDDARFQELATKAETTCPVSKLVSSGTKVTFDAALD